MRAARGVLAYYWFETSALAWHEKPDGSWAWRPPSADEAERLMEFSGSHSHVPRVPGDKKSLKLSEATRRDMLANSWGLPCLRFWAICLLFSTGVQPATAEFAVASLYSP